MGNEELKFRHEMKHIITPADRLILRQRLNAVATPDPHAKDGVYEIRSLYFDNINDKALTEKVNGINRREKFRIRYYNGDTGFIHLEKKSKIVNLCNKQSALITAEEAQRIVDNDLGWMMESDRPLVRELYTKMRGQGLKPKTIVDYTRDPYIFGPGNVRVTLDYNIRTGMGCTDFLNPKCVTVPAGDPVVILEVKWDEYLPDIIRDIIQLKNRRTGGFSKYAACRIYG
ncbi:MAG: polyphosphate polymerase domain-containing protein [Lachnospiraceae bacterium]|nr:polyphosphate polymerase domain-containing protein [Lachnospiraceae bacterium]